MTKKVLIYEGLKFITRQALEWYLMKVQNKTYEEARQISGLAETVPVIPEPRKKVIKKSEVIKHAPKTR